MFGGSVMKRALVIGATAMLLLVPGGVLAHHAELPTELQGLLPLLPSGEAPEPAGSDADQHSDNMLLVSNWDDDGSYRQGSDLAFWGNTAVLGNFDNPGGFRLLDISDPSAPTKLGQFRCAGPQGDVSIWKQTVFVSVDSPRSGPQCGAGGAPTTQMAAGNAFEGIRVVSISDPANPRQVAFVNTDCGSHTHTLMPDESNKRVYIYALSYPLSPQGTTCNAETHRKFSVIEVPLADPASARVVSTPDVSPAIGCHDVTVLVQRRLAAAACITESQLWDISDPAKPRVISHIVNPAINIHHSTTFSWDGDKLVIGDELGGAAAAPGCAGGDEHLPLGALWFYDVSDPASPKLQGSYRIPQQEQTVFCTAHNFNTVPVRSDSDVLVSAWYNGGTTVLDFTDPTNVVQRGFYVAKQPKVAAPWSSYWYRGFIYSNNFDEDVNSTTARSRGLDVLAIADRELRHAHRFNRLNPQTMEPIR